MKKILSLVTAFVLVTVILTGCGNTEQIKEELRGTWSYDYYAAAVGEQCHQIYKFGGDGTVESAWINETAASKSTYNKGTYKIKGKKIIITYEDKEKANRIEYSYNNGNLKLFDKGSDGSVEQELKKN